jgi:hypothetical protein
MEGALSKINRPDYPAGMILWLEQAAPGLYAELTSGIPNEIDQIWNEHESLDEFEAALDRLVAAHREAGRLYREDQARRKIYWAVNSHGSLRTKSVSRGPNDSRAAEPIAPC